MSTDLRAEFTALLARVAPGEDLAKLDAARSFRDQLEIDSMDYLRLLTAVADAFGVEVSEADYPSFQTVDQAVNYIAAHRP